MSRTAHILKSLEDKDSLEVDRYADEPFPSIDVKMIRKYLIVIFDIALFLRIARTVFAYPEFVTAGSYNDGGTSYTDGFNLFFPEGIYRFTVYSGAQNAWDEIVLPSGESWPSWSENSHGWMWRMNMYQPSTSTYYTLGSIYPRYETANDALSGHSGEYIIISQPAGGDIWFYQSDGYVLDNIVSTTAKVDAIPEPASMAMLGLGLFGLGAMARKKK